MGVRRIGLVSLAAVLAAGAVTAPAKTPASAPAPADELAAVGADNARLRLLGKLAAADPYALVLDLRGRVLELMLHGAVLADYPVTEIALGTRRVAFLGAAEPDWRDGIRSGGELVPPRPEERIEIDVPEPGSTPPSSEVLQELPPVAVPDRYRIRFADGFALEIRDTRPAVWEGLEARLADAFRGEPVRLRLTLAPEDSERLYRSLPPDVQFAVIE